MTGEGAQAGNYCYCIQLLLNRLNRLNPEVNSILARGRLLRVNAPRRSSAVDLLARSLVRAHPRTSEHDTTQREEDDDGTVKRKDERSEQTRAVPLQP